MTPTKSGQLFTGGLGEEFPKLISESAAYLFRKITINLMGDFYLRGLTPILEAKKLFNLWQILQN
jgi:hypothetical protein